MSFKKFVRLTWIFYPLVLAAAMYFLLPMFPTFTEYAVSRGLFKLVTAPIGFVSSLVPFSLTELLVILALPLVVLLVVLFVQRMRSSDDRRQTAVRAGRLLCGFVSFALLLYMVCHGANYYRLPLEQTMALDTSQKTAEHLLAVCKELARGAREESDNVERDSSGRMVFSESITTELSRAGSGYEPLVEQYPFLWTATWRQKPVQLSYLWSYTGIIGMYFPFFAENNVNIEQPDYSIPFTAAHESAHSRGVAFENECNFLAFLSCINSEYAEYRYSGYMEAFSFCANDLYAYDRELWEEAFADFTPEMLADLEAGNEYIERFTVDIWGDVSVRDVAGDFNDTFLSVQGVEDGSLSYNRVTELILAYYAKEWQTPAE